MTTVVWKHVCSFCRADRKKAEFIIAADFPIAICDACVDTCAEILEEKREDKKKKAESEKS